MARDNYTRRTDVVNVATTWTKIAEPWGGRIGMLIQNRSADWTEIGFGTTSVAPREGIRLDDGVGTHSVGSRYEMTRAKDNCTKQAVWARAEGGTNIVLVQEWPVRPAAVPNVAESSSSSSSSASVSSSSSSSGSSSSSSTGSSSSSASVSSSSSSTGSSSSSSSASSGSSSSTSSYSSASVSSSSQSY